MTASPIETERQRRLWSEQAVAWDRWADRLEEMAERFNRPLIEVADVRPGHRVLDLASGTGEPGLSLAQAVGPTGRVTLTDLTQAMLDGARRRAARKGLANVDFAVADAEALEFPDASFDRATCRFGIMFMPHPERALREAHRVLRPGGRVASMVWGPLAHNPMFRIIRSALDTVLGPDPNPRDQFRFGDAGILAPAFADAVFGDVAEHDLLFPRRIEVGERFWDAGVEMSGGQRIAAASEGQRRTVDREVLAGLEGCRQGDHWFLPAHVRIITASKSLD